MSSSCKFKCKYCNKEYSSSQSRSNHYSKFHSTESVPNVVQTSVPKSIHKKTTLNKEYRCEFCDNNYANRHSRWKHQQKCKNKNLENNNILEMKNEMAKYKKETEEEIKKLKEMLQKSLKIHPKTLNKINTQLNNNNTNNGVINNINIVQLGHEDLNNILTEKQKLRILNRQAMSVNDLVELVHISDKYKQFKNVYITNLQSSFGYKFDEKNNKFIAVNKNELLNDILDSRMYDIENFYEDMQYKMDPVKADQIKLFIDRMTVQEDGLKNLKKEEIKLILYNNREKIILNKDPDNILTV
jgi:hypothetical protein